MAASKDIGMDNYCSKLSTELLGLKSRLRDLMSSIELMAGPNNKFLKTHLDHLHDIEKVIDWKLEVLMRACPADWNEVYCGVENIVSVEAPDVSSGPETISAGFMGG